MWLKNEVYLCILSCILKAISAVNLSPCYVFTVVRTLEVYITCTSSPCCKSTINKQLKHDLLKLMPLLYQCLSVLCTVLQSP